MKIARTVWVGGKDGDYIKLLPIDIESNLPHLKKLVDYAASRIIILPGGGITTENAELIATELGIHEVHGTKIVPLSN